MIQKSCVDIIHRGMRVRATGLNEVLLLSFWFIMKATHRFYFLPFFHPLKDPV